MRLLILTQAVDLEDPILAFFHRWIEAFATRCETVHVVCLREGVHALPGNVIVHSLGKEKGVNRWGYIVNFYRYAWTLRREYDAVLVHMNPEYVVLGGLLWKLLGKPVGLWYVHKSVTLRLRIAGLLVSHIFSASQESIRIRSDKIIITGHGIDTDFFCRPIEEKPRPPIVLSAGRISRVKRHDLVLRALRSADAAVQLEIAGVPITKADLKYERELRDEACREARHTVRFLGALNQESMRSAYHRASAFVHASETGSIDKVVLEALACDVPVLTTADVFLKIGAPVHLVKADPESLGESINTTLSQSRHSGVFAAYVRDHHGLGRLVTLIVQELTNRSR